MERIIHDLKQGTEAWHQFRLEHFGASEAAAMLGISSNVKRSELLRMKHTGIAKEYSDWFQENVLDHGHAVEAKARPIVEEMIGDDLYPATYSFGKLSASCDGMTMDEETAFEHKQWNESLAAALRNGELPDEYQPQCQQIMMVTGAKRVIFVCSDGTRDNFENLEIRPIKEWQERISYGWQQFERDLAEYVAPEVTPQPVAAPIADLPALTVELVGQVTSSNLAQWQGVVTERIKAINTDLKTDQDFADAEETVKFLEKGEKTLELVKSQALSQTATIDELFRAVDNIKAEMRTKRLELGRTVEAKKQSIRTEIEQEGQKAIAEYVATLNERVGGYMPLIKPDLYGRMKGKRSVATLREAMETALANGKAEADRIAGQIEQNIDAANHFIEEFGETLFYDMKHIVTKEPEAFAAIVKLRVFDHKQRIEAEANERAAAAAKEAESKAAQIVAADTLAEVQSEVNAGVLVFDQPAVVSIDHSDGPTIKLGEICTRLGFTVSAEFLESLGFKAKMEKNARLYPETSFPTICRRISEHVMSIAFKKAA